MAGSTHPCQTSNLANAIALPIPEICPSGEDSPKGNITAYTKAAGRASRSTRHKKSPATQWDQAR